MLEVSAWIRLDLIRAYLSARAVKLLSNLDSNFLRDDDIVKTDILSQFSFSPCVLLQRFSSATRQRGETSVLFMSRLKHLLSCYLKSRKVSSFDQLFSLLLSDRLFKSFFTT